MLFVGQMAPHAQPSGSSHCPRPTHTRGGIRVDATRSDDALSCRSKTPLLQNTLPSIIKSHRKGAQEDAHEYTVNLLDSLHECSIEGAKKYWKLSKEWVRKNQNWQLTSPIYQIFGGLIRSQVTCAACHHQSNTYDPTVDLSLEIGKHCQGVEDCMTMFTAVETLGNNNAYTCDKCKQKTRATKQLTVETLPNVMILHLKRFDFLSSHGSKINRRIRFYAPPPASCAFPLTGIGTGSGRTECPLCS